MLSSGTVNVPAASLSVSDPPGSSASGTFAAVLATKASTKQLVVNGAAITDNGGFDALCDLLGLFVREQRSDAYEPTSWYASRSVGRWYIHSSYYGDESFFGAEAAAA